jgi:hypothetical protein
MPIDPQTWTRAELERHSVDMRQFIDFRQSTLSNGMRIIEAYNSSGLTFTILPDRGMDIWTAHYNGIPLTWISQGSPHPPDFGQTWLQQFNGGLLTTCGLTHVGPPEKDNVTGEWRDIHGRYSRLRSSNPTMLVGDWKARNFTQYSLTLISTICETSLFGEQLCVERKYTLTLGEPVIHITDSVTNLGDRPAPLMLLYHINLGYPLVQAGSQLHIASDVYARDEAAFSDKAKWADYEAAKANYAEQVFFHRTRMGASRKPTATLANDTFGLQINWYHTTMPYFTQWKNTRQGIYVCGLEPGNCIPEGLNAARENGRIDLLEPGDARLFSCTMTIIEGEKNMQKVKEQVKRHRDFGKPIENCHLDDYAKFAE